MKFLLILLPASLQANNIIVSPPDDHEPRAADGPVRCERRGEKSSSSPQTGG